MIEWCSVS